MWFLMHLPMRNGDINPPSAFLSFKNMFSGTRAHPVTKIPGQSQSSDEKHSYPKNVGIKGCVLKQNNLLFKDVLKLAVNVAPISTFLEKCLFRSCPLVYQSLGDTFTNRLMYDIQMNSLKYHSFSEVKVELKIKTNLTVDVFDRF